MAPSTQTSEVNNVTSVQSHGSICTASKCVTVVFENNAASCFVCMVRLGQLAGLSKSLSSRATIRLSRRTESVAMGADQ